MTATNTSKRDFSVWHDTEEQWDPDHIDPPALRCKTTSFIRAAERLADDSDSSYGTFIVRDDEANCYRRIELMRGWEVKTDTPITLDELSAP